MHSIRRRARRRIIIRRDLRDEIDDLNARIYETVNNGVYKAGFATTQAAYEEAVVPLFETLDWLEERLSQSRYLCDDTLTEADIRLFTTLVRFDAVYHGHFKCNIRRLIDYEPVGLYTGHISNPWCRADGELRAYQAALLSEPQAHQPDRYRACRAHARL